MDIEIINEPFILNISGFSGVAKNKDYAATAFSLMDKMWQIVKADKLKNKGLNIWVYEEADRIFAGVELDPPEERAGLELKPMVIEKYARYKYVGPYQFIKQAGLQMKNELSGKGYENKFPYIEIYGHWTPEEHKLETTLIMSL
jgi:hypothetical protein